jgi:CheY-like chemotaxis protein
MNGSTFAAENDDCDVRIKAPTVAGSRVGGVAASAAGLESLEHAGSAGMPLSAAATGVADFTGAPHELAALLTGGLPPPSGRAARSARRIVLVEDQLDAREMMRALLELKGHSVVEAGDGRAAVETIERERPDVAVVDIGLPVMTGYEVAREIRRNQALDGVMLIALTGYGSQADVREAEEAGFDAHLTKPTEPERLFRLLVSPASGALKKRGSASWRDGEQRDQ